MECRRLLSSVLSYHNDPASIGANLTETMLTPANVNVADFGKLYSTAVDGQVYAQPLYLPGVNVTGGSQTGTHDVVFVATEHDSLYAIDARTGAVLWQDSFLVPEAALTAFGHTVTVSTVPFADIGSGDLQPEIGITGTPAIDASTGYLYLAAKTKQIVDGNTAAPHYVYTLYKVNVQNGVFAGVVIADTTRVTGGYVYNTGPSVFDNLDPNHLGDGVLQQNGQYVVNFNAMRQFNRAAVTLNQGNVYIAFGSHSDDPPYHGWILGYAADSLNATAVFNANPDGTDTGIWQSGGKIAVDPQGYMYVETGNGTFDTTLNAQGFPQYGDYGDSFIKLQVDPTSSATHQNVNGWGLSVADYFTPGNQDSLSYSDQDLGSGGPLVLPETAGSITIGNSDHPDLLVGAGKEGTIYLLDRNNMGHYDPAADQIVQEMNHGVEGAGSYDTPAFYFDGSAARFYYVAPTANAISFTISGGTFAASSASSDFYGNLSGTSSISASGDMNGIAWSIDRYRNELRAYNASDYEDELWTSDQAPAGRDALGTAIKFSVPTIADGQVFVGSDGTLVAYGQLVPHDVTASVIETGNTDQVTLNWAGPPGASGYNIYRGTSPGSEGAIPIASGVTVTSFTDVAVPIGTTYYYEVTAIGAGGESMRSAEVSAPADLLDTITSTTGGDLITLRQDPDGRHVDWSLTSGVTITAFRLPITDPNGLTVTAAPGQDTIALDYAQGDPLPAMLHLDGTFTLNGLPSTGDPLAGHSIDIGRSTVFITYPIAPDPIANIRRYLRNGYANGLWTGGPDAITSSAGTSDYAIGYADSADGTTADAIPNSIELKYTIIGDTNLDGTVDLADLLNLTRNVGRPDSTWATGDMNYDGTTNLADFLSLVREFGRGIPGAQSVSALSGPAGDQVEVRTAAKRGPLALSVISSS